MEFAVRIIHGAAPASCVFASPVGACQPTDIVASLATNGSDNPPPPAWGWSSEASERLSRVPVGFMRDATKQHIEQYAYAEKISNITLEVAEAGIKKATEEMEAVLSGAVSLEDIKKRLAKMASGEKEESERRFYFCGVCSHIVETLPANCPVCESSSARFIAIQKELDYFICDLCSQIAQTTIPDHCSLCGAEASHYHKIDPTLLSLTDLQVTWTDAARQTLLQVPEGFLREMVSWRIEVDARKKGISTIDPAVICKKYTEWSQGSRKVERALVWDTEAEARISRIPSFVQATVIKEMESYAKEKGILTITCNILDEVTDQWAATLKNQGY
jgi:rubrerythrin